MNLQEMERLIGLSIFYKKFKIWIVKEENL
jgi:hypothetical protein